MNRHGGDYGQFMIRLVIDQFSDITDILIIQEFGKQFVITSLYNGLKLLTKIAMFHLRAHAANLRTHVKEHREVKQNDH
jgi:hypothetical protein